jgi:putative ABC transport system ATP-binding protein
MSLIQAKNLRMEYCSNEGEPTIALDGVDFVIEKGEFVSIMGPSGSGKSTLLHILGMLDRQTHGTYLFEGRNSVDFSQDELAAIRNEKMGFVFQAFNLLARTSVLENVKLPLLYSKKKEADWDRLALSAIKKVGLEHRINHQPNQLSGGEKQRVAIARALINNPEVIFADEPTGNLDSKSGAIVMDTLMQLNEKENKTVILITHEHSTAKYAERIIHIKDGKVESDEKVRERSFVQNGYLK